MSKKTKKVLVRIMLVIILALVLFALSNFFLKEDIEKVTEETQEEQENFLTEKEIAIEEIRDREDFQERIAIRAEKIYWEEKKEREIENHNNKIEEIEKELEELRASEIDF